MADLPLFRVVLSLVSASAALAQLPQITPGGVVSSASYGSPIAPGELISIFGSNFTPGASVTINNIPAPISLLTPTQINTQVPANLPTMDPNLVAATVVVTTPAGSSRPEIAALAGSAPMFFTTDGSGCGQAAALNAVLGGISINSASNSAAPGDYLALYGTGFSTASTPTVFLDGSPVPSLSYSGPAPGLTGVEQVNFQIPASTRNGCSVPVSVSQVFGSPMVTLAVQNGRGKCTDPPIQSYGVITLSNFASSGFFSALFPSGPNVQAPAPEAIVFAPQSAIAANVGTARIISSPVPIYFRSCAVPGYTDLSAGTIQVQPPSGSPVTVPPQPMVSGVSYGAALPGPSLVPGTYTISGSLGSPVPLNTSINVGSPIQITSSFPAGATISLSQPLTVTWTGGDIGSLVRVAISSSNGLVYSYAHATDGSLTFTPQGLVPSTGAQIAVTVVPSAPKELQVPGITQPIRITWQYGYNFGPLTLGN